MISWCCGCWLEGHSFLPCLVSECVPKRVSNVPERISDDLVAERVAAQARTHYSMWCMMKAVMLLGADLMSIGPQTLAIIKNEAALSINQDSYGNQARRIAVQPAQNLSLAAPSHALALLAKCTPGKALFSYLAISSSGAG